MLTELNIDYNELNDFCNQNGIKKFSFFGSVLGEDFKEESDVDILVEFEEGKIPGLFALSRIQREFSELIGREVDLRTPNEISKYFRDEVVKEAVVKYG